jgi:hypothetical protein
LAKLHRSLNALCVEARIEDAVLPNWVAREVHIAVRTSVPNGAVDSQQIKTFVFDQLDQLSKQTEAFTGNDPKGGANQLKNVWERYQILKDDKRVLEDLARKEEQNGLLQNAEMTQLKSENVRMTMVYIQDIQVTQTDLQQQYHLAREKMAGTYALPDISTSTAVEAAIPAVSRLLSTARHLLKMYRRQLGDTLSQLQIRRLINRLAKVGDEIASFNRAEK